MQDRELSKNRIASHANQIVALGALSAVLIALVINFARGKSDRTFDGVVVMDNAIYSFYSGAKDCHFNGTPYWLVPNRGFYEATPMPFIGDADSLNRLLHAAWVVKIHGDLSPIGQYGSQGRFWRQLQVKYVIDVTPLNCGF